MKGDFMLLQNNYIFTGCHERSMSRIL